MVNGLSLILTLTLAALGTALAGQWQRLAAGEAPPASAPPAAARAAATDGEPPEAQAPPFELPPLDRLGEQVARPLFEVGRRPPAPDPVAQASEPPPAPAGKPAGGTPSARGIKLTGVVIVAGEASALVRDPKEKRVVRVRTGDRIGDWEVIEIRADGITLGSGEERVELALREFGPPPPPRPLPTGAPAKAKKAPPPAPPPGAPAPAPAPGAATGAAPGAPVRRSLREQQRQRRLEQQRRQQLQLERQRQQKQQGG